MRDDLSSPVVSLLDECRARSLMIATAESCTGGLIAAHITDIAGASDVLDRGFVVYSNDAKSDLLGVSSQDIARYGAVSEPVVCAMADGALLRSSADLAIAVTGIAGPGGGNEEKPVGLVYLAIARRGRRATHWKRLYSVPDRRSIRQATVKDAIELLLQAVVADHL